MYADSTPVVASTPSCTRRSWPPARTPRESIYVEPDWHDEPAPVATRTVPRHRKPVRTRTYITAGGVVRETEAAPVPARVTPLSPDRTDAPKPLPWREELDWEV